MNQSNVILVVETTQAVDIFHYPNCFLWSIIPSCINNKVGGVIEIWHFSTTHTFNSDDVVSIGVFKKGYVKIEKPQHNHYEVVNAKQVHSS